MGKLLIGIGAIIAAIFVAMKVKAMRSGSQAGASNSSVMPATQALVEESGFFAPLVVPQVVDNPGGTFLGNSSDVRSPINVIKAPGSTLIRNNPVLEWSGNIPMPGPPIAGVFSQVPVDSGALLATRQLVQSRQTSFRSGY